MPNYKSLMKRRELMERKVLYKEWKRSGLTKTEFCKQNDITRQIFHIWIKQLQNHNYINGDGNEETSNIFNDADDTNIVGDNVDLEIESIKFLKVSELSYAASQKSLSLEPSLLGALEISLPDGTVVKATVSQNHINNFLQEIIKDGNRSTI